MGMSDERKTDIVEGAIHKKWYRSTTFLATLVTELVLLACFVLVLQFDLDKDLTQKILSALVLAITFVAICFIAPKIAHDAMTRLPAVKGLYDKSGVPQVEVAPPDDPPPPAA